MYSNIVMEKLIKFSLVVIAIFYTFNMFMLMFMYQSNPVSTLTLNWTLEEMTEYRARVIIPAFYLTVLYFIYRYFAGKNPTSAIWPMQVSLVSLIITQVVGFIVFLPFSFDAVIILTITTVMLMIINKAHKHRKNEIF